MYALLLLYVKNLKLQLAQYNKKKRIHSLKSIRIVNLFTLSNLGNRGINKKKIFRLHYVRKWVCLFVCLFLNYLIHFVLRAYNSIKVNLDKSSSTSQELSSVSSIICTVNGYYRSEEQNNLSKGSIHYTNLIIDGSNTTEPSHTCMPCKGTRTNWREVHSKHAWLSNSLLDSRPIFCGKTEMFLVYKL